MSVGKSLRFRVFARDGFVCQYCGQQPPEVVLEVDHIHPTSKGGDDDINNLLTSCFNCNRGKRGTLVPAAIVIAQAARAAAEKAEQEAAMMAAKAKRQAQIPPRVDSHPHPLTYLRFASIEKRVPVGRQTIARWIREGRFPSPVALGGGPIKRGSIQVWRAVDIDEWIRQNG